MKIFAWFKRQYDLYFRKYTLGVSYYRNGEFFGYRSQNVRGMNGADDLKLLYCALSSFDLHFEVVPGWHEVSSE